MLIRAYRIQEDILISSLDPLSLLKKDEHPELRPETYGFEKKISIEKNLSRWSSWNSIWKFK